MSDTLVSIVLQATNKASGEINAVASSIKGLDTEAQGFLAGGYSGLENALSFGLKAAAGAGVAALTGLGAVIGSSVSKAANFESAMSNVAAISRASDEDLARLTETAKEMGSTTAFTSKEAAEGMSFLAMAGFDVNDTIAAMPGLLSTAAAGNIDLADTADIVSNVLSGFGLEAEETGRVADILAATFTSANTDLRQLGEGMKYVAPVAESLQVPVEEVAAAMGILGNAGIQGSMAGTTLRGVISRLVNPTGKAADVLADMGLIATDYEGAAQHLATTLGRDVEPTFDSLRDAFQDWFFAAHEGNATTEEATAAFGKFIEGHQQNQLIDESTGKLMGLVDIVRVFEEGGLSAADAMTLFGDRAGPGMMALMGQGSEALSQLTGDLYESGGVAQEIAGRQLDNLQGAMTLLGSAVDGVQVAIGDAFLPILTDLVRAFTELVQDVGPTVIAWFEQLAEWLGLGTEYLRELWQTGEIFNDVFSELPDPVQAVVQTLVDLYDGARRLLEPVLEIISNFFRWEDVLIALGAVITGMAVKALAALVVAAAPVVTVAAGLITAVALLRNAWENDWLGIRTFTLEALEFIKSLFEPVVAAISAFGGAALAELWDWVQGNETSFWAVRTIWATVKDAAAGLFEGIVNFLQEHMPIWIENLKAWGTAAWEWIAGVFPIVMGWIGDLFGGIVGWVGENLEGWVDVLGTWAAAAWQWLRDEVIPRVAEWIANWGGTLWDWLSSNLPEWLKTLGAWAAAAWQWLRDTAIPQALEWLGTWGRTLWDWLSANLPEWLKTLTEWGVAAWTWLRDEAIPKALKQIRAWRDTLMDYLSQESGGWGDRLAEWGAIAWQWIKDVIPTVLTQIMAWRQALFNFLIENLPSFVEKIGEWALELIEWIGETIPDVIREFGNWLENIIRWSDEDASPGFMGMIAEWVLMLWEWVEDELWPVLEPALKELGGAIVDVLFQIGEAIWDEILSEWVPALWEWIQDTENGAWPLLKGAFEWLTEKIGEIIGNIGEAVWDWMKDVGKDLVDGVKQGVSDAWGGFSEWLTGRWEALVSNVKGFFGIQSPSTVFSDIGKSLMEGLEGGIETGKTAVGTALDGVQSMVNGVIKSIHDDIDELSKMTIKPPKVDPALSTQTGVISAENKLSEAVSMAAARLDAGFLGGDLDKIIRQTIQDVGLLLNKETVDSVSKALQAQGVTAGKPASSQAGDHIGQPFWMSDSQWNALSEAERARYREEAREGALSENAQTFSSEIGRFASTIEARARAGIGHMDIFDELRGSGFRGTYGELFNFIESTLGGVANINFADSLLASDPNDRPTHEAVAPQRHLASNEQLLFSAIFGSSVGPGRKNMLMEIFDDVVDPIKNLAQAALDTFDKEALGWNPLTGMADTGKLFEAVEGLARLGEEGARQVHGVGGVSGGDRMLKAIDALIQLFQDGPNRTVSTDFTINLQSMRDAPDELISTVQLLNALYG